MIRTINLSSNAGVLKFIIIFSKTKYKKIEFLDTDEAKTGKRKDIVYTLDDETFHEENESTPVSDDDVLRFHNYNKHIVCDKSNIVDSVLSYCICTAKPQKELLSFDVEKTTLLNYWYFT